MSTYARRKNHSKFTTSTINKEKKQKKQKTQKNYFAENDF